MAIETKRVEVPDEKYEHKTEDKVLEIYREQNPFDPRDIHNIGTMTCSHKRYNLGDEDAPTDRYDSWAGIKAGIKEEHNVVAILPLYLLDHGVQRMKASPFKGQVGRWDSGQVGFIYTTKEDIESVGMDMDEVTEEDIEDRLRSEVETYDNYLRGEIYRFVLKEDGEDVDRCGGFNGVDTDLIFEQAGEDQDDYEKVDN